MSPKLRAEQHQRRKDHRRRDNLQLAASILGIILTVVMVVIVLADEHKIGTQRALLVENCRRLNIVRIEDNISHAADYKVFRVVLVESAASPPPRTRQQQQFENQFLAQLAAAIRAKAWTPRTNCDQAVNTLGARYRPPPPVRFSVRQPDRSAVTLEPEDFK